MVIDMVREQGRDQSPHVRRPAREHQIGRHCTRYSIWYVSICDGPLRSSARVHETSCSPYGLQATEALQFLSAPSSAPLSSLSCGHMGLSSPCRTSAEAESSARSGIWGEPGNIRYVVLLSQSSFSDAIGVQVNCFDDFISAT